MRCTVKLFAILRDRAGVGELSLELAPGTTAQDVGAALLARYPQLGDLLAKSAFAVNRAYVPRASPIADGDEVALIPPVSGG